MAWKGFPPGRNIAIVQVLSFRSRGSSPAKTAEDFPDPEEPTTTATSGLVLTEASNLSVKVSRP